MEEIAHINLSHEPVRLEVTGSLTAREFRAEEETEAYATGAAALVPYRGLKQLVSRHKLDSIAGNYGVTKDLIEYRLKVTGLWPMWLKALRNQTGNLFIANKAGMLLPCITQ